MTPNQGAGRFDAFVEVKCLCGKVHTLLRNKVLEGLSISRWKCAGCRRRFVVSCTPEADQTPEAFWPVFLDNVPSTGSTVDDGVSEIDTTGREAVDEIHFQCRCGCRLVGRSHTLERFSRCPRCRSRLLLRVGYKSGTDEPVAILEYPDDAQSGQDAPTKVPT